MNEFERSFSVNPEGETEIKKGDPKKRNSKKKLLAMETDRIFVVDKKGETEINGSKEEKIFEKETK